MKSFGLRKFLLFSVVALLTVALSAITAPSAQAQNMLTVTKITSQTAQGGSVLFETSGTLSNALALAIPKSELYVRCYGYTGGTVWIQKQPGGATIFRGPVSGITVVPTQASDSLKILFFRQYLTNAN